ncbi:Nuclear pore complex protein NUP96 [Senna tora]|uniref:Nuclear pore complex protein NUP96 n=1 Tax=Senna tora TaxID=362788 RepID=A0A834XE99_9FABA|nr:Nuclear pore complex protein NUP96 [Senna tora]
MSVENSLSDAPIFGLLESPPDKWCLATHSANSEIKHVNTDTASCTCLERRSSGIGDVKTMSKQLNLSSRAAPSPIANSSKSHISSAIFEYTTLQN